MSHDGIKVIFWFSFKLVHKLPNGLVLVLIASFQLIYLILEDEYDAFLRLDWLTMTVDLDLLLFGGGLIMVVVMTVSVFVLSLALRTLVGALLVSANLINHELLQKYQLIIT
jgi:hypothetical protein